MRSSIGARCRPLTFQSTVIPFPSIDEPEIIAKPGLGTLSTIDGETESSLTRPITRQGFRKSLDKSSGAPPLAQSRTNNSTLAVVNVLQRKKKPSEAKPCVFPLVKESSLS